MVRNPAIDPSIYHGEAPAELPEHDDYERNEATPDEPVGSTIGPEPIEGAPEPFEGAYQATIPQTLEALGDADEEKVEAFIAWEQARTDRAPRTSLIEQLGAQLDD